MKEIKWIFKNNAQQYEWCIFRNDFFVDSCDDIHIDISALDRYVLYINGSFVSRGPVRSYNFAKYYDHIDITQFVKNGKNSIVILSQYVYQAGVYAAIGCNGKVLCETDETWKTRKYEAFDNTTNVCCPPLEPVCLNEEIFDARVDVEVLLPEYDFGLWENSVYVHSEYKKIIPYKGGLCSRSIMYPVSFMGAAAVRDNNDFCFRLKNKTRKLNKVRKCTGEIYVFTVKSDREREVEISIGNIERCSLNGKPVNNKALLREGDNFFVAYYYSSDSDPYFIFKDTQELSFLPIKHEGFLADAGVFNLRPDDVFFSWSYPDADRYKDTDGNEFIEKALKCTCINELSQYFSRLESVEIYEVSVCAAIEKLSYGTIPKTTLDSSLRIKTDFECESCSVTDPVHMLNANAEYTIVNGDVALFFDFGSEKLGYIDFNICAPQNTVIDMMGFEVVDFKGMRHMQKNCMRYICRNGWQKYTAVNSRGMRYLCMVIKNAVKPVKIGHISVESSIAMTEAKGGFNCDNQMLNSIYNMCVNTVALCMSDSYLDCPGYEQVFWLNDGKHTSETNLKTLGAFDFDYRCIEMMSQSMLEDYKKFYRTDKAYTENKYLTPGAFGSYVYGGLPIAGFNWGLQICDYYLNSGDAEGVKKLFPMLKKMLSNCDNMMSSRGLFAMEGAWNLIEWAQNDVLPCGELTVNSALLAKLYANTSRIAEDLGDEEYAAQCIEKSQNIIDAINKYCWNDEVGAYVDTVRDEYGYNLYVKFFKENGLEYEDYEAYKSYTRISEQTNLILQYCGCVTEDREEYIKKIVSDILKDDYTTFHSCPIDNYKNKNRRLDEIVRIGTPFSLYYLFNALADYGDYEGIIKVILRSYSYMIECGTDTCWETFYNPGADAWTRSVCHAWGSTPAIYLQTEICGIKPLKPGYREFSFKPHTAGLKKIKTSVPTPYGKIYVQIDTEQNIYKVDYPKECKLIQL